MMKFILWLAVFLLHLKGTASFCALQKQKESLPSPSAQFAATNQPLDTPSLPAEESSNNNDEIGEESESSIVTNAILRISYDGSRFTGWSAANSGGTNSQLPRQSKKQRRRGLMGDIPQQKGFVRSVEGVIRDNLAQIFGKIDPKRIVVEGCSRTDRGVHARGTIAQIYCLKPDVLEALESSDDNDETTTTAIYCSIPGKRKPHPTSPTDDSYFEPLPMNANLSRLVFALNRMRSPDMQVTGIAPTPTLDANAPFHPSLSTVSKTYEYQISTGAFQDPTMPNQVWHVGEAVLDVSNIQRGCEILRGSHDFSAFQGAPRGPDDKRKRQQQQSTPRATTCTLSSIELVEQEPPIDDYFQGVTPPIKLYKIVLTGDRFLYKMVRFLVGALAAVGTGKLEVHDLERALASGNWEILGHEDRRKQFKCAPAHGLVLHTVDYGDLAIDWQPLRY
jgi:tRNA pseudouridine38-40 synthase